MDDKMDPNSSLHSLHHPRQYLIGRANFYIPLLITRRLGTTKPPDSSTDLKLVLKIISISSSPNKKKKKKKRDREKDRDWVIAWRLNWKRRSPVVFEDRRGKDWSMRRAMISPIWFFVHPLPAFANDIHRSSVSTYGELKEDTHELIGLAQRCAVNAAVVLIIPRIAMVLMLCSTDCSLKLVQHCAASG